MIIELNNLLNQTVRFTKTIPMAGARRPSEGVVYSKPVELDVTVIGKDRDFKLLGEFSTVLSVSCHRCLRSFELPIRQKLDLVFIPRDQMPHKLDVELADKDMNIASYKDSIDLCQIVDEQVVLALPMKSLCSEDCKGLCPHCGKNLNESSCTCEKVSCDPRLVALKEIKVKLFGGDNGQGGS